MSGRENLNQKIGETREILKRAMGSQLGVTMVPVIDNIVSVLVRRPHATFADVLQLIDPGNKTIRAVLKTDPTLTPKERDFWKQYDDSTYYQQAYGAVYNRFNPFTESPIDVALASSSFSFKHLLNSGRYIVFLDLSELRGQTLVTMGQLLLATIEQALLSRNPDDPNLIPYSLFIDEFQKYAEDSEETLKGLYNGARKFQLGVTIAHQSTADIPPKLKKTITDNVGTIIAGRLSAESSAYFANELQLQERRVLQNQQPGQAYVRTPTENVGLPTTIFKDPIVPLPPPISNDVKIARSKENFGKHPVPTVEEPPAKNRPFGYRKNDQ